MSQRIFFSVILILGFITISLVNDPDEYVKINKENCKKIINEDINLIYVFSDWCGISRKYLHKLYGKELQNSDLDINIILIGIDSRKSKQYQALFEAYNIEYPLYVLNNKTGISIGTFTDYPRLKRFVTKNFTNTDDFSYHHLPFTFFADKNLNIITEAGQTIERIAEQVTEIKDSLNINQ